MQTFIALLNKFPGLKGNKTYIVALVWIGWGIYEINADQRDQGVAHILIGLGMMGFRNAIQINPPSL